MSDDGVGFPDKFDIRNSDSLGLMLVNGLVPQIQGNIELDNTDGTVFIITFNNSV